MTNDFSLDGCRTRQDVEARRELITNAARHQQRAHCFDSDDLRTLRRVIAVERRRSLDALRLRFLTRLSRRGLTCQSA